MPENLPDDIVTALTITAILRLNQALNRHDVDAVMAAMTTDCVLKSAFLRPEGKRYQGHNAVRQGWETFFRCSPTAGFEIHEILPCRDRCVVPWMYHGVDTDGKPVHARGVDLYRVQDGKVAAMHSYATGEVLPPASFSRSSMDPSSGEMPFAGGIRTSRSQKTRFN